MIDVNECVQIAFRNEEQKRGFIKLENECIDGCLLFSSVFGMRIHVEKGKFNK